MSDNMSKKHEYFLEKIEKMAKSEDVRYFAAVIEGEDVHYCGHCGINDIKALMYVIATEYPEAFREISSYIESEQIKS